MADTPKIRFKGFMDAWEQRKLGDFGTVSMCKRIFKEQTSEDGDVPFYKIGTFGGTADAFISRELFEEYKMKYPYPPKGAILISASGSIGRTVEFTGNDEYFQDSNIVWLTHDKRLDDSFLKYLYEVVKWAGIEGSTIKRLYNDNILKTEVDIPQIDEQRAIGTFFRHLDHLITLHQRKCVETIELKKYMLQKMFPKEGKKNPEIRFAGYTGAWERRKLGDMMFFSNGFNGSNESFGSGTALISVMDILNNDFITYETIRGKAKVSNIELERFKVEYGDVLFQRSSENIEDAGTSNVYLDTEKIAIFGGFVIRGKRKVNYDPVFIKYLLDSSLVRKQIVRKAQGAQHINVSQEILQDIDILYPLSEEDVKIGNLLRCLDGTITLYQRKCNELREVKKFMLQNMFPQKG